MPSEIEPTIPIIRTNGGLFPNLPIGLLAVKGQDRVGFLHNLLSHDIKGLLPGQAQVACLLNRQGKIVFTSLVHIQKEAMLLSLFGLQEVSKAKAALERYRVSERVEMEDMSTRWSAIGLIGPNAACLIKTVWPSSSFPEASLTSVPGPDGTPIASILRWDILRLPGFLLWVETPSRSILLDALWAHAQALGFAEGTPECLDVLRIEAGIPWPGREMTEEVIWNELECQTGVSFTKGCFVGQEIVARIRYRGHPPRRLMGLLGEGPEPIPCPAPLETPEGETVGQVTSSCFSPTWKRPIALGFLAYRCQEGRLKVLGPSGPLTVAVQPLPFAFNGKT
jgi:folate-binding protein YgfZ